MLFISLLFNQSLILNEASLEAIFGDKHKFTSKVINFLIVFIVGLFGYVISDYNIIFFILNIILYLGQRFATFDYLFPILRYKDINKMWYLGTTSKWDIWLSQFNKYYILAFRMLGLITSILLFILAPNKF